MAAQLALLPEYLTGHLLLTLVALAVGAAVSVPVGVFVTRSARLEPAVLGVASVVQTIPGLALLAVMVPALAILGALTSRWLGLELRSIGYLPAIIALTLYSVLPILRNTVTGIAGIEPSVLEAARAVGMTDRQRLWRVELPLAMPVIIAGFRTAAVWVVGTATLSTPVGATSLGNYIFTGLQTRNYVAVLTGCASAAVLALVLDGLIRWLELGLARRRRSWVAGALGITLALYAGTAVGLAARFSATRDVRPITIGAKTFTEQYILSELLALRVEERTGRPTRILSSLGSTVAFDALSSGEIDVYVDYSGTIWATILKRQGLPGSREEVLTEVRSDLRREHGVLLVAALGFENTYALGMRGEQARKLGVVRISDLVPQAPSFELAGDYEFFGRPEWVSIRDGYGLSFRATRSMDSSLMYQAVREGEVDVITAFSTDGRIAAFGIRLLEDDRGVIPPYDAIVLAGRRLAARAPDVVDALRELDGAIDLARMQGLNLRVDRDGEAPRDVARDFARDLAASGGGG